MEDPSTLITNYQPGNQVIELVRASKMALLVGISGAGKDTIKNQLLRTGDYHDIITNTTRPPRINHGQLEQDGVHYHFTAMPRMIEMLKNHELIEVNKYGENLYGTSVAELQNANDENKIAVADIDVNGVTSFYTMAPNAVRPIFLIPPTYDVWYERWQKRYGDNYTQHLDDLASRRQTAIDELEHVLKTPYFFIVINADLDDALAQVNSIAMTGKQDDDVRRRGYEAVESVLRDMKKI
jgi:guanylate kinase